LADYVNAFIDVAAKLLYSLSFVNQKVERFLRRRNYTYNLSLKRFIHAVVADTLPDPTQDDKSCRELACHQNPVTGPLSQPDAE
jgi:hypothetical protein